MTARHELQRLQRDMTHMLVHDLRSPLSGVWGAFELLEHAAPEQHEVIALGMRATRQVMALTDSLLELGQLEAGARLLERRAVPLSRLVEEVGELMAARPGRAPLDIDVSADLPPVWADRRLLRRVLQNLLDNAFQFTPPEGRVRLSARECDEPSGRVRVEVSDTGPGVAASVRERLFQKFARGDQQRRGFGLGLAFCRLAVEAHGGLIGMESVAGQGATFWFTLPTAPPEAA
jgi:signal transduction histidine kinase